MRMEIDGGDRRAGSARTGCSSRAARCRSAPSASTPRARCAPYELELAVERLCLDSTSHRNIRERCDGDPERMSARILEIVARAGQDAQPRDRLRRDPAGLGDARSASATPPPPRSGERVATLGSLTLTPLRLEAVTALDPDSPQVEVARHRLRVRARRLGADPRRPAARRPRSSCSTSAPPRSQVAELVPDGRQRLRARRRARRQARAGGRPRRRGGDAGRRRRRRATRSRRSPRPGSATSRCGRPARPAGGARGGARRRGAAGRPDRGGGQRHRLRADGAAADRGRRARSCSSRWRPASRRAALAADGIGTAARMVVGSGYSPDRGALALDLARGAAAAAPRRSGPIGSAA